MNPKVDLSLDDIIATEGIGKPTKGFTDKTTKNELNFVVNVDNNSNNNKRKVDFDKNLNQINVSNTSSKGSHFPSTSGQIFVDNLKYEVNDEDIQQLFGAFGTLKRGSVNYQIDGRSAGTAFVVFEQKTDAETAVTSLQNITLDGRPLHLTLINSNNSFNRNSIDFQSRVKRQAIDLSTGGAKGRHVWSESARKYDSTPTERGYRRFNKTNDNEKEVLKSEDLDADLDSYLAQRKKD